jgi:hypothetical protein
MRFISVLALTVLLLVACNPVDPNLDPTPVATGEPNIDSLTLTKIADKLHVSRDWAAVKNHVYCKILKLGRPLKEAEAELEQVDQIQISHKLSTDLRIYSFFDTTLSKNLGYFLHVGANSKMEIEYLTVGYYSAKLEAAGESIPIENVRITCPL